MLNNVFGSGGNKSFAVSGGLIPQFPSYEYGEELTGAVMRVVGYIKH